MRKLRHREVRAAASLKVTMIIVLFWGSMKTSGDRIGGGLTDPGKEVMEAGGQAKIGEEKPVSFL